MRRPLCPSPCGSYTVRIENDRIVVNCAMCGDAGRYAPAGARRLAAALEGPLGRFETTAPRPERLRLAKLLRVAAAKLTARRIARRKFRRTGTPTIASALFSRARA
jgi:hypothetical protein